MQMVDDQTKSDEQKSLADSPREFAGVSRLYGADAGRLLSAAHVMVIGIGGVGSWAAEALARSGVGRLTLVDLDSVAASNVNRQVLALQSSIGAAKVDVMRERIADINPACKVVAIEDFLTINNLESVLASEPDFVIDAIDAPRVKAALIAYCVTKQIPIIVSGAAGGRDDPLSLRCTDISQVTGDALLANVRARLRRDFSFARFEKKAELVSKNNKKKLNTYLFKVSAIHSVQTPLGNESTQEIADNVKAQGAALNCSGYGSIVTVTAAMGLACAARAISTLISLKNSRKKL
jgi:tRNA threonylcarbamoyladenosine dehydratase